MTEYEKQGCIRHQNSTCHQGWEAATLDNIEGRCEFLLSALRAWHVKINFLWWADYVDGDDCTLSLLPARSYLFLWSSDSNLAIPTMVRWQLDFAERWVERQSMRMYWRSNKTFADPQKNKYCRPGIRFVFFGWRLHLLFFTNWPCCYLIEDQGN